MIDDHFPGCPRPSAETTSTLITRRCPIRNSRGRRPVRGSQDRSVDGRTRTLRRRALSGHVLRRPSLRLRVWPAAGRDAAGVRVMSGTGARGCHRHGARGRAPATTTAARQRNKSITLARHSTVAASRPGNFGSAPSTELAAGEPPDVQTQGAVPVINGLDQRIPKGTAHVYMFLLETNLQ